MRDRVAKLNRIAEHYGVGLQENNQSESVQLQEQIEQLTKQLRV